MEDKEITNVKFLKCLEDGDILAIFPHDKQGMQGDFVGSYQTVGQHSPASPYLEKDGGWVQATKEEYKELKVELEGIGYNLNLVG